MRPSQLEFWTNEESKNESIDYDKEASKHFFKALDIAANAFAEEFHEKTLVRDFPEFYREFVYIRALVNWDGFKAISEEEKKELQEEMERQKEEFKEDSEDLEDDESLIPFDLIPEDPDVNVLRFVEIMEKLPEQLTDEMKREAFDLYPKIFAQIASR